MAELRTRRPSGQVAFPLILVEGEEKAGKSVAALTLSSSPNVGRTFVLELGEPTADEYAQLGPYDIIEHNGTFSDMLGQLEAACAIEPFEGRPNVIVLDSATALWDLLKDWATMRARGSNKSRATLAKDPDADIETTMNYWNDAKDRWGRVLNLLRGWPGIVVLTARGGEVAKVVNGQPVQGQTEYRVDAEKNLAYEVSAWVRMRRPHAARLMAVRSLSIDVPQEGLLLPDEAPLDHLIFGVMAAGKPFTRSTHISPSLADERGGGAVARGWESPEDEQLWAARLVALIGRLLPPFAEKWHAWQEKFAIDTSNLAGWTLAMDAAAWLVSNPEAAEVGVPIRQRLPQTKDQRTTFSNWCDATVLGSGDEPFGAPEPKDAPSTAETGAEGPQPGVDEQAPAEEADDALVQGCVDEVVAMRQAGVDKALRDRELSVEGSSEERRRRLIGVFIAERKQAPQQGELVGAAEGSAS